MKKTLFLSLFSLIALISNGVKADINCDGGEIFTTTVEGKEKTFCLSKVTMNLWSAMAWCKAHGLELTTVRQICGLKSDGSAHGINSFCLPAEVFQKEITETEYMWTQTSYATYNRTLFFAVDRKSAQIKALTNTNASSKALCQ